MVSLWRREGFLRKELAQIRLRPGDVLVLQGDQESLANVARDPAFLILVPFHGEPLLPQKARLAGGIMLGTIVVAALNLLTIALLPATWPASGCNRV